MVTFEEFNKSLEELNQTIINYGATLEEICQSSDRYFRQLRAETSKKIVLPKQKEDLEILDRIEPYIDF